MLSCVVLSPDLSLQLLGNAEMAQQLSRRNGISFYQAECPLSNGHPNLAKCPTLHDEGTYPALVLVPGLK